MDFFFHSSAFCIRERERERERKREREKTSKWAGSEEDGDNKKIVTPGKFHYKK